MNKRDILISLSFTFSAVIGYFGFKIILKYFHIEDDPLVNFTDSLSIPYFILAGITLFCFSLFTGLPKYFIINDYGQDIVGDKIKSD